MAFNQHKSHLKSYLQNHKDNDSSSASVPKPVKNRPVSNHANSRASSSKSSAHEQTSSKSGSHHDTNHTTTPKPAKLTPSRGKSAKEKTPDSMHKSAEHSSLTHQEKAPTVQSSVTRQRLSTSAKERVAYRQKLSEMKLAYTRKIGGVPINWLPDEILLEIFRFFTPQDLLSCGRVCKRWHTLASDNLLWQHIYKEYASKVSKIKKGGKSEKAIKVPKNPPVSFWKSYCIKKGAEFRNGRAMKCLQQKKIHPFTGLQKGTQEAIQKCGLRWVLSFIDDDREEHTVYHNDVFYFNMATSVRWYNFQLPSIHRIKKLRIYSGNPIFFDDKGQALPNSPLQRSILYETDFKLSEILEAKSALGSDDVVKIFHLADGLSVATWKDENEVAFITMSFHNDNLTQRCLQGSHNRPWMPAPHKPFKDDIDTKYGLHSYTCTLELRNMRTSFWCQQFMNLHCPDNFQDGHAVMQLIDPDRSFERSWIERKIYFPWKTEALKGIVQSVCMMDVTLLDDQRKPIWCSSGLTKIRSAQETTEVMYEYDGDYHTITYTDPQCGKVIIILIWEESSKNFYITSLQLHLSVRLINYWFGRRY